jgi:hypothetical protein
MIDLRSNRQTFLILAVTLTAVALNGAAGG